MQGKRHHISEYGKFRDIVERFTDAWKLGPVDVPSRQRSSRLGIRPGGRGEPSRVVLFFQEYLFEEMRASRLNQQANRWERKKKEWSRK